MAAKDNSFGWRLRCAIQATQKTQKEICAEIGISAPTLSQYLAGNRDPSITTVVALAKTLNVSADYLLGLSSMARAAVNPDDFVSKYDFRDSTIRFFEELQSNYCYDDIAIGCADGIPNVYKPYVKQENWTYVRGVKPIVDEQSFFYDILEHPKMSEISNYVFYYQIARSYMRIFKDRRDAYSEDLDDTEKWYAACLWDTPSERIRQYENMSEESRRRHTLSWLVEEQHNYYVDGIPTVYADKAMIYREQIKQCLCQIIDDCCEKFELSHDSYFHQEKEHFIASMKNYAMIHSPVYKKESNDITEFK